MPLTNRPHSLNIFGLSKISFKSLNLRICDSKKITYSIENWLFADELEKPEEHIMTRSRKEGGLSLINVQYKSQSHIIRSFLETALLPSHLSMMTVSLPPSSRSSIEGLLN